MKDIFKRRHDRYLFALSAAAFAGSLVWTWQANREVRQMRAPPVALHPNPGGYRPVAHPEPAATRKPWPEPAAQAAGAGWVYELFTPPIIFYQRQSAAFVVMPPAGAVEAAPPFDFELAGVERERYRLQLAGYFGQPGGYTAIFANRGTPDPLLIREGNPDAASGFTLKSFSVRRVPPDRVEDVSISVTEVAVVAELFDDRTGSTVLFDSRRPAFTDAFVATIRSTGPDRTLREVRAGEVFSMGMRTYRIDRICLQPAEVTVDRRQTDLSLTESFVLRLPADPTPLSPSRPATGFATNKK